MIAPSTPTFVAGFVVENGGIYALVLQDNYLYLGSHYGLEILNISNLDNITKVWAALQYNWSC